MAKIKFLATKPLDFTIDQIEILTILKFVPLNVVEAPYDLLHTMVECIVFMMQIFAHVTRIYKLIISVICV